MKQNIQIVLGALALIGVGIGIGAVLVFVLTSLGFITSKVNVGPIELEPPTSQPQTPLSIVSPTVVSPTAAPAMKTYKDMVVGFVWTGPEGAWIAENNASIQETAAQLGITLKIYNGQENVDTQVSALRQFIQDPTVNIIVLDAVGKSGFDNVLNEAKAAGKLVVLEDRSIDSSSDLYYTHIGSDFVAEGQRGAAAMCNLLANSPKKNVVEITGPNDAGIGRDTGFRQKMGDCGITITQSQNGNWDVPDSKAVMAAFLKQSTDIQGVFAHNDEEAIGAIQAIKEAGLVPGRDIQVIGFDATADGFAALINGTLGADIECNPLLGPQVFDAALKGLNGDTTMPKFVASQETVFAAAQGADALKAILATRKY